MSRVDLVFRTVGERTADIALELAIKHIRPDNVHIIDNVKPFAEAVNQMLKIPHDCDQVVYVDADCLILEDMRPFLDKNTAPYVDSYVSDRFRGRLHCGVHITRIDVVRAMATIEPPTTDHAYVLRPESRIRNKAMRRYGFAKRFRNFEILHDWFQSYRDIFHKYALRELRSRTEIQRKRLTRAMQEWEKDDDLDLQVARYAIEFTRNRVPLDTPTEEVDNYIRRLFEIADEQLETLGLPPKPEFTYGELERMRANGALNRALGYGMKRDRVFGIGLSRTGTRSLTAALQVLGYDVEHYPTDKRTLNDLVHGNYAFQILDDYDGITDITVAPFYRELDEIYPDAKFILTTREKKGWLKSCRNHWYGRGAFAKAETEEREIHMKIRRFLRAAVYGTYGFDAERFSHVYDMHVRLAREYFADKQDRFLELNIPAGDGFDKLAPFLGRDVPSAQVFPHKGKKLTQKLEALEIFD